MLKMLIADDEALVRETLKMIMPWKELAIEIIGEASDGEECYRLSVDLKPDILITDIKMPVMDGLQVAMKLNEEGSDIKIILLSGIEDFNYARTALEINAEGYLLKPIKVPELSRIVKRVTDNIYMDRNREEHVSDLRRQLDQNRQIIKEKFLTNLVLGIYDNEISIYNKFNYFDISIKNSESLMVAILKIDRYSETVSRSSEEEEQLLSFSVGSIVKKTVGEHEGGLTFCTNENEFIIIFNEATICSEKHLSICEETLHSINRFLNITASIGLGTCINDVTNLRASYKAAKTALEYRFYTGESSIINFSDLSLNSNPPEVYKLFEMENQLINFIKLGNIDEAREIIDKLFEILGLMDESINFKRNICIEVINASLRTIYELNDSRDKPSLNLVDILSSIFEKETISELKKYVTSITGDICEFFKCKFSQKNLSVIKDIKNYINKNYMLDISLPKIAEETDLSPNYVSQIFKQETNHNITDYIREVRMEAAKKLLQSNDLKIQDISEMVGYDNPQYFSTVFKKYTGIYPQKYRQLCEQGGK
jgi:two-component system, response regulator YesN